MRIQSLSIDLSNALSVALEFGFPESLVDPADSETRHLWKSRNGLAKTAIPSQQVAQGGGSGVKLCTCLARYGSVCSDSFAGTGGRTKGCGPT